MRTGVLIKRLLPNSSIRNLFRVGAYLPIDASEFLAGKRKVTIPPRGMRFDSADSYLSMGQIARDTLIKFCGLNPESSVLDAGCGAGRAAIPFTTYLTSGTYDGFDIVSSWIGWCQRNITPKHPNVRFAWVDVYSKHYNSTGRVTAEILRFPYEDNSFNCAMLLSVFTHMLPEGIRNYIRELSRVLKPGGKAFITAFLLNDESVQGIETGTSAFPLNHLLGDCRVADPEFPETAIGIPEQNILTWCAESNLGPTIMYGSWPGRSGCETIHDSIVVEKTSSSVVPYHAVVGGERRRRGR